MIDSIFTKIIRGEIPSYKIYEDDKTLAFLTIQPSCPGHTLVVPKKQVDKFYDLMDEDYIALFAAVKKVARRLEEVFGQRTLAKIIGTDVPHAHVHLFPLDPVRPHSDDLPFAKDEDLAAIAKKLRLLDEIAE